jgi:hypothetical protein
LLEFAVYTLVPRLLDLVPLHGAAVAHRGRAALLTGPSGSGKSTAVLSCAQQGLALVAEDAVFLDPRTLKLTGCANYLHLKTDGLALVHDRSLRAAFRRSPVIRRRSGARKFELDLRASPLRAVERVPTLSAVVALSPRRARGTRLLERMEPEQMLRWLRREQPYARSQPQWPAFERGVARLPAYRLLRGSTPAHTADALRELLAGRE